MRGKIESVGGIEEKNPYLCPKNSRGEKNLAVIIGKLLNFSELQFLHLQSCHEVES